MAEADTNALSVGQIALVLKLKDRRVQQLADAGILPRAERGKYALIPCVQAYILYLRGDGEGDEDRDGGTVAKESATAKARMIAARARIAELEADQLDGLSLARSKVDRAWADIILNVRTRLLLVPARAAPLAHQAATVPEAAAAITTVIHDALGELSRIPVYDAAAPDGGGQAGGLHAGSADAVRAAARPDHQPVGGQ